MRVPSLFFLLLVAALLTPQTPGFAKRPKAGITHVVKKGEYLNAVAKKYGVSVEEIQRLNHLKGNTIRVGQELVIRKKRRSGKKKGKSLETRRGACFYKVRKGDFLYKIAKRKKTTVAKLRKLNGRKARRLRPGDSIRVCKLAPGDGPHKLYAGSQLPETGPGYIAPRRNRVWARPHVVKAIQKASADVASKYPGTNPVYIGDISFQKGGYMPPHKSHRTGLDADIGYFFKGNPNVTWFKVPKTKELDAEKVWDYFQAFIKTGTVKEIYVDYRFQRVLYKTAEKQGYPEEDLRRIFEYPAKRGTGHGKMIRHFKGHRSHFHIRFDREPGQKEAAIPQPESPPEQ